jgi:RHS repeat-associated protein
MRERPSPKRSRGLLSISLTSCLLTLSFVALSLQAQAQNAEFTQNNRNSHAMTLEVPLVVYPGRGASMPVTLRYSSGSLWRIGFVNSIPMGSSVWRSVTEAIYAEHSTAGWTTSLDVPKVEWPKQNDVYWYTGKPYPRGTVAPFTYRVAQLFMHMPDGSIHEMRKADAVYQDNGTIDMTGTFYAIDGSRMRYDSSGQNSGTLYLPDGSRYVLGSTTVKYIDRNGNTLNYSVSNRQWTDTMGRVIGMPWPANPGPGEYTYSLPGVSGINKTYKFKFSSLSSVLSLDDQGQTPALRRVADYYLPDPNSAPTGPGGVNFPQVTTGDHYFNSGYTDPSETPQSYVYVVGKGQSNSVFNPTVLAEIELPTGQKYKFFYNIRGEIDKVIFPSGGYERYQYSGVIALGASSFPYFQGNRGMISRWLSPSGTGNDEAQTTYSTGINPLIVTAPDQSRTETYLFTFPMGPNSENFGYRDQRHGMIKEARVYSAGDVMLRRTLYEYAQSSTNNEKPDPPNINNPGTYTAYRNVRLTKQVNLILDTGGDALAATETYEYAQANQAGYQFTTGLDRSASTATHFQTVSQSIATTGLIADIGLGATASRVETVYLNDSTYQNRHLLGLPISVTVKGIVNGTLQTVARTESYYDEVGYTLLTYSDLTAPDYTDPNTTARGNVTTVTRYVDAAATIPLQVHAQFDQCGNLRKTWNERGIYSETEYSATYRHAYATKTITPIPDPSGAHGSSAAFESSSTFDFTTGLTLTSTDINGQVTTISYQDDEEEYDPLNRVRKVTRPDGGWTKYAFGDSIGNLFKLTETKLDATRTTKTYEYFDPLGRVSRSFASELETDYIATDVIYDQMGRTWKSSNPYRTASLNGVADVSHTSHWTVTTYDALGRVSNITLPDSSVVQTSYQGVYTTVTDQAGKLRRQKVDAWGRIVRVDEPDLSGSLGTVDSPAQPTFYEYDTQGNLVHIAQGAGTVQHRYFKYDALGRLTHERQVEQAAVFTASDPVTGNSQWSRRLVYDETIDTVTYSGLLTSAHDARNIQTRFRYDRLNRTYQITYSDGTPTVTNKYDQSQTNYFNNGHLTEASTAATGSIPATSQVYNFDLMGRVAANEQIVGSNTYSMSYSYNLGGALTSQQYPSQRIVNYTFDDAARLSQVSSGATIYANQFDYSSPTGLLKSLKFGNDAIESYVYNSRLQLESRELTRNGTQLQRYNYKYGVYNPVSNTVDQTKNNGQIAEIDGLIQTTKQWTQRFAYDSLGRLSSAREFRGNDSQLSYFLKYEYDVFGNRYQKQSQNTGNPFTQVWVEAGHIDLATNRFNSGVTYDNAGNITVDSKFRNRKFEYDANNRQKQSRNLDNSGAVDSVFDANGQRVATQIAGLLTNVLVYDALGKLVAEYNSTTVQGGTQYIFDDHQGTPRTITNNSGTVIARHDYLPFGEDIPNNLGMRTSGQGYGGTEAARQKYAGMETDEATGMAHTLWRKFDSLSSRWTSPDPYAGSMRLAEPQSFNRYTYVNNDPVNHVDPTGLALSDIGVYHTTDERAARWVERWSLNAHQQATQPNGPGALGSIAARHVRARVIRFEKKGDFNILGRTVPFYMAAGVDEQYEKQVTDIVTQSIDLLNENATKLTAEDEDAIAHVNVIAAAGRVRWDEWFWVEGMPGLGPDTVGSIGINLHSGVFFDYIFSDKPNYWAPLIAHEGQHRKDFMKKTGAYAPGFAGDHGQHDERRALIRQLLVYRRMFDRVQGSRADPYERMLAPLIINPHQRTYRN